MSVQATRAVLRQSRLLTRKVGLRYASSTSETASKATEAASSAASKASQGLSRVTSSAGPAITSAAQNVGGAMRKIGGRTGKLISFVDSLIPPTVYYSKVGLELAKLVFRGQNMTPPNMATFQTYLEPVLNVFRNPSTIKNLPSPQGLINRVRNANAKEIALAGVTAAEVIGFFTVGEMIGRMNLVGYRGEVEHHGEH